jgi:hypothetical protein
MRAAGGRGEAGGVSLARAGAVVRWYVFLAVAVGTIELTSTTKQLSRPVRTEERAQPGNGATLVVVAPQSLCSADVELTVARTISQGRQYVFQTPVAPPECRWVLGEVWPGDYQAVLQRARGDRRVVGLSRLDVYPGSTWTTTVSPLAATVEGLISSDGRPVGSAHIEVFQNGPPGWSWETRTDNEGYYEVAVAPDESLCIRVRLVQSLNLAAHPQCGGFGPDSNRRDFDIPPGRIIITLAPRDGPIHDTQILLVLSSPGLGMSGGVSVTGRSEHSFAGLKFGKYRLRATTMDDSHNFDAVEVVLSPDEPVKNVTLSVPYSR